MRKLLAVLAILAISSISSPLVGSVTRSLAQGSRSTLAGQDVLNDDHSPNNLANHHRELGFSLAPGGIQPLPLPQTTMPITIVVAASFSVNDNRGIAAVVYVAPDAGGKLHSITPLNSDNISLINDSGPGGDVFDGIQLENHSGENGVPAHNISYSVSMWW